MSLLLDALKKAEHAKRMQAAQPQVPPLVIEPESLPQGDEFPSLSLQLEDTSSALAPAADLAPAKAAPEPEAPKAGAESRPDLGLVELADQLDISPSVALPVSDAAQVPLDLAADLPVSVTAVNTQVTGASVLPPESLPVQEAPVLATIEPPPASALEPARPAPMVQTAPDLARRPLQGANDAESAPAAGFAASPESAQRVLASKPPRKPVNRTLVMAIGGLLLIGGMAGYLWWQMQPPALPAVLPPADSVGPVPSALPATDSAASPVLPAADAGPASAPGGAPSGPAQAAATGAPPPDRPVAPAARAARRQVAGPLLPRQPAEQADQRMTIQREPQIQAVDETLVAGYQALQKGDMKAAHGFYRHALQDDPQNRDALLGMAAIAVREGRVDEAERWYRKLLTLNPLDSVARGGLAAVARDMGSGEREAELRNLSEQPGGRAAAASQLGGLYAAQKRWGEAQQQYFRAWTLEPERPDHAFNLAVSLEHLDQPRLALDFYRKAQALAGQRKPGFDPAALKSRIDTLAQP